MFKAIWHEKQILIVSLVFILLVNTTNLTFPNAVDEKTIKDWSNTAEASSEKDCSSISEPDDDFYCKEFDWGAFSPDKQSVDELCDASEDYAKNPKNCDIAYGLVEKQDKNLKKDLEEACDKAGGKMEDGYCDVKSSDGKQADKFYEEQTKLEQEQRPIIVDGRNTVTTTEDEGKRYVNPDGGAPLYEDELTEDEKDYYEEYKPEKEQKQIEDLGNTVTDDENEITPEEAEEMNEQNEASEQEEEEIAEYNEEAESSYNKETQKGEESVEADEQVEEEQDEPEEEEDESEEEEDDNSDSESEE